MAALTAINTIRLIGGSQRTLATVAGSLHPLHYLPGIGDMIAGMLAPVAVYMLLRARRGGSTGVGRTFALAWNLYGFIDLVVAIIVAVAAPPADAAFRTPVLAFSFMAIHLLQLVLLNLRPVKLYYSAA
ncbi:MAG: hypothetical protein IAF08_09720 [Rhizobacter sp.]|nr:hypothetical protein [Chlorobiales bacterium]